MIEQDNPALAILQTIGGSLTRAFETQSDVAALPLPANAKGFYLAHKVHTASFQLIEALLRLKEWAEAEAANAAPKQIDTAADSPDPASLIARARAALGVGADE